VLFKYHPLAGPSRRQHRGMYGIATILVKGADRTRYSSISRTNNNQPIIRLLGNRSLRFFPSSSSAGVFRSTIFITDQSAPWMMLSFAIDARHYAGHLCSRQRPWQKNERTQSSPLLCRQLRTTLLFKSGYGVLPCFLLQQDEDRTESVSAPTAAVFLDKQRSA